MLYRKMEALIEAHLTSDSQKILLIDGARQVGKTYLIRYVGQKLFENFIEINLVEDSLGDRLFAETRTVEDLYLQISMLAAWNGTLRRMYMNCWVTILAKHLWTMI